MRVNVWAAKKLYSFLTKQEQQDRSVADASTTAKKSTGGVRDVVKGIIKRLGLRTGASSGDFESPEEDLDQVTNAYAADAYVRQGVDKYVDQMFKEGYDIFGKNEAAVVYLKQRLAFIAEGTGIPTGQLLQEVAEDVVKYSNAIIVKARSNNPAQLPPALSLQGVGNKNPIVGYFPLNVTQMAIRRDKNGVVQGWQQETESGTVKFSKEDVIHIYYKRAKGNAFGTPFLMPVLDDVRALRQAEENVLRLMYRHIYPFYHAKVGTNDDPGTPTEVDEVTSVINNMDVEGGIATTNRVEIKPIATNAVLDAAPYLRYFEERVFSGMGIPAIMFGRGNCYDEETETLTDSGWKYWYQIRSGNKIATYNPITNGIEYHAPNDDLMKYVSHYTGKMVHFKSKHVDIKVSPQHDMWVCTNGRKPGKMKWKKVKAIDLYESKMKNFYFLEQAEGIDNTIDELNFDIPSVDSRYTNGNNDVLSFNKRDFVEFLGYFVSEGCLYSTCTNNNGEPNKFRISLSQQKSHVLDKMIRCVESLGLKYSVRQDERDGTNEITLYHKSLWIWLKENVGVYSHEKKIPREIMNSSRDNLEGLLDALISGDGTIDQRDGRTSRSYYSVSMDLINDVQEICIKLGYKAKIGYGKPKTEKHHLPVHRVLISNGCSQYRYITSENISIEEYDGIMYCYNVPNHLFITRRNGKVAIQGNTANRSTGDNMTTEMGDRVKAMKTVIEMFINSMMFNELLMEGGYDSVIEPMDAVELKFRDNDADRKIKMETHAIFQYEHNAITEPEMRSLLGRDPVIDGDRETMFLHTVTIPRIEAEASAAASAYGSSESSSGTTGTKATNNKQQPTNQYGTKPSPKKQTNSYESLVMERFSLVRDSIEKTLSDYAKGQSDHTALSMRVRVGAAAFRDLNKEIFGDNDIPNAYFDRLFRQMHEDIIDHAAIIENVQDFRELCSTTLDLFEDKIHIMSNHIDTEGKENRDGEDEAHGRKRQAV